MNKSEESLNIRSKKDYKRQDIPLKRGNMQISDFVGAIFFGIVVTGVSISSEYVSLLVLSTFVMSFFVKWLFEKIWSIIKSFKEYGFLFVSFLCGIFVVIGVYVSNLRINNLWLIINGALWIGLAFILLKNYVDEVFYGVKV